MFFQCSKRYGWTGFHAQRGLCTHAHAQIVLLLCPCVEHLYNVCMNPATLYMSLDFKVCRFSDYVWMEKGMRGADEET